MKETSIRSLQAVRYQQGVHIYFHIQNKHLIISLLDDYHNIYTVKMPTQLKLSIATHMASSLLDIFETGPSAIPLPQNRSKIHGSPSVVINRNQCMCRGGIVLAHARSIVNSGMQSCNASFLCQLPDEYRHIKPKDTKKQLQQFR